MSYILVYTKRSVKDINKLDKQVKKRIKESLEKYSNDPFYGFIHKNYDI